MTPEQFLKLKRGDMLFYNDDFEIESIDTAFQPEREVTGPYTVYDAYGGSLKITDAWLDEVEIITAAFQNRGPGYLKRIELVIGGIEEGRKAWEFLEVSIEETIERYGGYLVEIDS